MSKKKTIIPVEPVVKKTVHYTADYIINPAHPVTVNVIGCGGTGSQVITLLARMHAALLALGHTGLYVRAIDPDKVTDANMGRQLFSPADVGFCKCTVLIGRINRFFGTDWEAIPQYYTAKNKISCANITISCVDSGAARKEIKSALMVIVEKLESNEKNRITANWQRGYIEPFKKPFYWMDFGNMQDRGQVVLGTLLKIKQPAKSDFNCKDSLPTIDKVHPDILKDNKKDNQGPSCSLAEALGKQDLFINSTLAQFGMDILWKLFREARLTQYGAYVNLESLRVNPIELI